MGLKDVIKRFPRLYDFANRLRKPEGSTEVWLHEFARQRRGLRTVIIQVGANDGLRWDPVRRLLVDEGWTGVLVEPIPAVFRMLKANYRYLGRDDLLFVNAAVSDHEDEVILYCLGDSYLKELSLERQLYWLRKSSTEKEHLARLLRDECMDPVAATAVSVGCVTVQNIVDGALSGETPHLLFSDAEGHDDRVIYGLDLSRSRPNAIVFESHSLGSRGPKLIGYLEKHGYEVRPLDGDAVAVDRG